MQKAQPTDHVGQENAANPSASLISQPPIVHSEPAVEDRPPGELGVADVSITTNGARARLRLGKEETGLLTQADLQVIGKQINQAIQQTY